MMIQNVIQKVKKKRRKKYKTLGIHLKEEKIIMNETKIHIHTYALSEVIDHCKLARQCSLVYGESYILKITK